MTTGASCYKYRLQSPEKAARPSSWFPGIDVAGAHDGFLGCHHLALLRLVGKLSHVGGDVEGLACRRHRPTICS
jgi:hypothetical protein